MTDREPAGIRAVKVWQPELAWKTREDGTTLIWREDPLGDYPDRLTDMIDHWADRSPDRIWMAQRSGDDWQRVSYRELRDKVRRIGEWLLRHDLSAERPVIILSENSVEHALMALGAQYAGIPSAAISPAYALVSTDYAKLKSIAEQVTPGVIFVQSAEPFAKAIAATFDADIPVIAVEGRAEGRVSHAFAKLLTTEPGERIDAAHQAIGPDTVAKFLFTSGTTGSPKAVIQTNRMLCSNMVMVQDCFAFMVDEPPVVCDWAPWNHTASGNKVFNMVLFNGGTFYIDDGKPTPAGMARTIRNLREVSPTWYFNVPAGFEALVHAMETDDTLRESFFRDLKLLMYAGAGLAAHTWRDLERLAVQTVGQQILIATGLGSTETAPFALMCVEPQTVPGNIGVPARGVTLKLVPVDDKQEVRIKGPNVTPGYWRAPELTHDAFDDEGFYRLGDALRHAVPGDPSKGFYFDGRIAENFKLRTGTWVAVGALRAQIVNQMGGLISDAVIAGENEDALTALLVPAMPALRALVPAGTPDDALAGHPAVRAAIAARLAGHIAASTGSATRIARVMLMREPLSLDRGEVTDKGSINQRAVLRHRPELVARLYRDDTEVIHPEPARAAL
ncbi:feruloyl-CoA synthase [Paracoccus sp. (in: a-proteobacteria)]|uniref:feruloyl-CoA synthase n=1 Tax=Paracoccus sp. TaxID=267 RepID=UPI003A88B052